MKVWLLMFRNTWHLTDTLESRVLQFPCKHNVYFMSNTGKKSTLFIGIF